MKSLLRILVWIVGILVVLVVVAMIGLKLFFPAEKVKELAVARGSDMLGREIAVSGLDVSLWGGLGVKLQDVVIGNPPGVGGPPFLAAENIDLKLQLFPLLSGDLRVDRLIVEAPRICMLRTATGEVNYSFETADSIAPQEFDETGGRDRLFRGS